MTNIPFPPYLPDVLAFDISGAGYVNNVLPRADGWGPIGSPSSILPGAFPGTCRGYFSAIDKNSTPSLFGGSDSALLKYDFSTDIWKNVNGSSSYALGSSSLWTFQQFGNLIIATTAGFPPQVFDLSSSSVFANLGGSPPTAQGTAVVGDFLVAYGLPNPRQIAWCGINNATQWTPGSNLSDIQIFADGGPVRSVIGGEFGYVFQDSAIRQMLFSGGQTIFQFTRISEDRGLLMPFSVTKAHSTVFFLSVDGFYKLERGLLTPIGHERVDRTFFADADLTSVRNVVAFADPGAKTIYWSYKSKASALGRDKLMIYDWGLDRWSAATLTIDSLAAMIIPGDASISLDSVTTKIPASLDADMSLLPYSLDDGASSLAAVMSVMKSGIVSRLTGLPLEAIMETGEGAPGEGRAFYIRGVAPITDAKSAIVSLRARNRAQDDETLRGESAINVRGYCPMRVEGRYITARLRIPANSAWKYARGIEVDGKAGGMR